MKYFQVQTNVQTACESPDLTMAFRSFANGRKRIDIYARIGHQHISSIDTYIGLDKHIFERKIVNIVFLSSFHVCFGCSKEPSH